MIAQARQDSSLPDSFEFLRDEHTAMYLIATCRVPYIALCDGYTMGGVGDQKPKLTRLIYDNDLELKNNFILIQIRNASRTRVEVREFLVQTFSPRSSLVIL